MNSATQYRIFGPNIIHENIDNEVIVMNMDTGIYYSLTKTAASIWNLVGQQASTEQINSEIMRRYDGDAVEIERAVAAFMRELLDEALIRPVDGASHALAATVYGQRLPFEKPTLLRYDDMQDLLLLDPIHEVDDTGWPTKPGSAHND